MRYYDLSGLRVKKHRDKPQYAYKQPQQMRRLFSIILLYQSTRVDGGLGFCAYLIISHIQWEVTTSKVFLYLDSENKLQFKPHVLFDFSKQ